MAITRVNNTSLTGSSTGAAFNVTVNFALQTSDLIFVTVAQASATAGSVKDSVNNTNFTKVGGPQAATNASSTNGTWFAFQAPGAMSSGFTITVTPGTAVATSAAIDIFRGVSSVTLAQAAVTSAPARATTWTGPALGSNATAGNLVITGAIDSSTSTLGLQAGNVYTQGSLGTTNRASTNYYVLSASGSSAYAVLATCGASNVSLAAGIFEFTAAGGASPVTGTGGVSEHYTLAASGAETFSGSGSVSEHYTLGAAGAETFSSTGGVSEHYTLSAAGSVSGGGPSPVTGTGGVKETYGLAATGAETFNATGGVSEHYRLASTGAETFSATGGPAEHYRLAAAGGLTISGSGGVKESFALAAIGKGGTIVGDDLTLADRRRAAYLRGLLQDAEDAAALYGAGVIDEGMFAALLGQ